MKQIFILTTLLISLNCFAQSYQLNVSWSADIWGYISDNYRGTDSTGSRFERKLYATVQANKPIASWTQLIPVDTVPNSVIIWSYSRWKQMPGGLRDLYDNSLQTSVNAMTNAEIVAARTSINASFTIERTEIRARAKAKNIDN